jgi:phenylacetic acid degradation operon negative regulatory protein
MSGSTRFEDLLVLLLWTADKLTKPTFHNLTETFEGWEWRTGLKRRLQRAEDRGLVQRVKRADRIVYQLTELGNLAAAGGADAPARWRRSWDGCWRQILFDLPAHRKQVRIKLWRWLRANGFGYLQNSVWIHPDPVHEVLEALEEFRDDVETFLLMEARCCAGYSNAAIVAGAWDFAEINKRYRAYLHRATLNASELTRMRQSPAALKAWIGSERIAWQHALEIDPLLPRVLWPSDYEGERAWAVRTQTLQKLSDLLSARD